MKPLALLIFAPFLAAADGEISASTTVGLSAVVWLCSMAILIGVYKQRMENFKERLDEDRAERKKQDEEAKQERKDLNKQVQEALHKASHNGVELAIATLGASIIESGRETHNAMLATAKEMTAAMLASTQRIEAKVDANEVRLRDQEVAHVKIQAAFHDVGRAAGNYEEMDRRLRDYEARLVRAEKSRG